MGALTGYVARLLLVKLPLGALLGVAAAAGWMLLERQSGAGDYPVSPVTMTMPPDLINPAAPASPSQVAMLQQARSQVEGVAAGLLPFGFDFGSPGYGVSLGVLVGLLAALPLGFILTVKRYGLSLVRLLMQVVYLAVAYVALFGGVGYGLAVTFGSELITSGYLAVLAAALPILVPLPMAFVPPLFPGRFKRQAERVVAASRKLARGPFQKAAKRDAGMYSKIRAQKGREWEYCTAAAAAFMADVVGELHVGSKRQREKLRAALDKRVRSLNAKKAEHPTELVRKYVETQLDAGSRMKTPDLAGMWMIRQVKGAVDERRDAPTATGFGQELLQTANSLWAPGGWGGTIAAALFLWLGVAAVGAGVMYRDTVKEQLTAQGWHDTAEMVAELDEQSAEQVQLPGDVLVADGSGQDAESDPLESNEGAQEITTVDPADDPTDANTEPGEAQPPSDPTIVEPGETQPTEDPAIGEKAPVETPTEKPNDPGDEDPAGKNPSDGDPSDDDPGDDDPSEKQPSDPTTTVEISPAARTWTDAASGRTIEATWLGYKDGSAELKRTDGSTGAIPLRRLTDADRAYVVQQLNQPGGEENGPLRLRQWTDSTGERKVEAALLDADDTTATFIRPDGRLVPMPLEKLSEPDQAFVQLANESE